MRTATANGNEIKDAATHRKRPITAILAASSGNLVEWFDFYSYAYLSIYFAHAFFPQGDQTSQLMATAGIFALGFVIRPLGGWVFGWLADARGRKVAMIASVLLMCAGSLMIACLPTYSTIGIAAPLLLLFARLAQGLSVGGEYGTAATYMSEIATKGRRGFYSSLQYVTIIGGQILALLVLVVLERTLGADMLRGWAWRIPFILGAFAALLALYLRRSLEETSSVDTLKRKEAGSLKELIPHRKAFLFAVTLTTGGTLFFYTFSIYIQKYLLNTAKMNADTVSTVMTFSLIAFMLMQPAFGMLADRIGRKRNLLFFSGFGTLAAVPLLTALGSVQSGYAAFGLIFVALLLSASYTSISGLVKAELFPPEVRALGVGLSFAIANALFGGTAEYVALALKTSGHENIFAWYVAVMTGVALLTTLAMPDTQKHGYLDGDGKI